jgi:hypothetical protein
MTITGPDARSAAPGQAVVDAALLVLGCHCGKCHYQSRTVGHAKAPAQVAAQDRGPRDGWWRPLPGASPPDLPADDDQSFTCNALREVVASFRHGRIG